MRTYYMTSVNFTSSERRESTKCGSLKEKIIKETEQFLEWRVCLKRKNHKLDELTSKNLSTKPSSFLISTSQVMWDAVSESKCSGCGKSGEFPFKKEKEPQTGILKLEFLCSEYISLLWFCLLMFSWFAQDQEPITPTTTNLWNLCMLLQEKTQRNSQSDRQNIIKRKPPLRLKKKKNRHDTVGYENPETILWKKRVTYSYQLLCSQLAGRGARKLVIMKWLQTSYTVGILLITESYSWFLQADPVLLVGVDKVAHPGYLHNATIVSLDSLASHADVPVPRTLGRIEGQAKRKWRL